MHSTKTMPSQRARASTARAVYKIGARKHFPRTGGENLVRETLKLAPSLIRCFGETHQERH